MRSFPFAARVAVGDKLFFKQFVEFIDNEMVHHTVTKVSSKYFPFNRLVDNKGNRVPRLIAAIIDFLTEINQIVLVIKFKSHSILRLSFVATTVFVSLKKLSKRDRFWWKKFKLQWRRFCHV